MANKILQIDLFENYKKQPTELKKIVNKYSRLYESGDMDYNDTKKFLKDVNSIGYTFNYGLDNMPYGLRPIGVKIYELKGFENEEEEEFAGGGGVKKQNPPQSKSYTKKNDIQAGKAKPVGKRYTDKLAKKLGKSPNAEPTQKDINKYLGKGVYDEKRKDKSDISLRNRFDIGGMIDSIPSNSDIFLVVDNSGSTSNYYDYNEIVSNFRRIFPDIKVLTSESYGRIVEIYSQIPEGRGGFDIKSFIDWIEMYEKDEWSALDSNVNNKYIIILTDGYEDFDVDFPNNTIILTTEEGKKIIEKNYPNISANITTLEDTNMFYNGGGVDDTIKNYSNEQSLLLDGFKELANSTGIEFNPNDFTLISTYDKAKYYLTKDHPSTNYKVERIFELTGRSKNLHNAIQIRVDSDYLWGSSKYSFSMSTAEVDDVRRVKSTQSFFLFPYYKNRYNEVKGGLSYADGGGVELTKKSGEISKIQLENMVGKKLNGWNDDVVYYNGKKYQKCYLRPYYKVC